MKHKLLITDDEQSVRIFLKDLFLEEGFDVCEAKDGKETLEAVRNDAPHIFILDLKLPDLNGLDVDFTGSKRAAACQKLSLLQPWAQLENR